ncbi:unnamed protein product [Paramecium pentaurelia]|uniref:MSP domain-containing protein n=1 Tax=Paramecium pentaurelia TaxID=43138 RepID=A0A8S1SXN3_9CILI|nr:unnamed protein product [Paramecium pentaurelia]
MDSKYKSDNKFDQSNSVEINPPETLEFEVVPNQKKIYARVKISNNTPQDVMFRIKTTAPDYYVISYDKEQPITTLSSQDIHILLICDQSRIQHRLKDKFLIQVVEKQKYDAAANDDSRWSSFLKKQKLNVSLIRKDLNSSQQSQKIQQQPSDIKQQSVGQIVQSRFLQGSNAQLNQGLINQNNQESKIIQTDEDRNMKIKLDSLKQKYHEQAKLIEQYKFDINELQNEIDRKSFIYDLEKKKEQNDQPEENISTALRDKTGIPLWELFIAATIALILGALLNRQ